MRKSNAEFTEEVFLRSNERKKRKKKYTVAISTGVTAAVLVLCLYMNRDIILSPVESEGEAEVESSIEKATLSVAINRGEGTDNTYMNTTEAERLVRLLDMYTMKASIESEDAASSESVTESENTELDGESFVYRITVVDVDGTQEEYLLYSDGIIKCEAGSLHTLTEEELDSLLELIE